MRSSRRRNGTPSLPTRLCVGLPYDTAERQWSIGFAPEVECESAAVGCAAANLEAAV